MAKKNEFVNVPVRLQQNQTEFLRAVADAAGVTTDDALSVMVASFLIRQFPSPPKKAPAKKPARNGGRARG